MRVGWCGSGAVLDVESSGVVGSCGPGSDQESI